MDNLDFNLNEKETTNDIYFSNSVGNSGGSAETGTAKSAVKTKQKKKKGKGVGSTYAFFIVVIVASMAISVYAIFCMNDVLAITKSNSSVTVMLSDTVETSDDAIDILSKYDLIKCKNFCKTFVKLRDKLISTSKLGGPYLSGVYYLNGKMGIEGMLLALQGDSKLEETVKLTFPEGYTVPEIIDKLAENDVCDKAALASVVQTGDFNTYLCKDLTAQETVPYRLEGFMFPDTYEFFVGENASSVVKKFVDNGSDKFTDKYKKRVEKLGYSTYEIMIIASIIQKEADNEDQMKTISGILYNRLKDPVNFPTLGCQSTSDYITNKVKPSLSSSSSHTADYYLAYYNTNNNSTVIGLPAGPICNPGAKAIEAALYPEKTDAKFFFHDTDGNMYTAKTYSEFKDKVNTYAPYLLA